MTKYRMTIRDATRSSLIVRKLEGGEAVCDTVDLLLNCLKLDVDIEINWASHLEEELEKKELEKIKIEDNISKKKKMIYLASPHSHTSSSVRQDRYEEALKCASYFIERGEWMFSPIVHSHNLMPHYSDNICSTIRGWDFWKEFDTETIRRMDEVWVLKIPGWEESKGVQEEIKIAKEMGKVVRHVEKSTWVDSNNKHIYGYSAPLLTEKGLEAMG